jgi:hypothetical protein
MRPDGVCPAFDERLDLGFSGSSSLRHEPCSHELPIEALRTNKTLPARHEIRDFSKISAAIHRARCTRSGRSPLRAAFPWPPLPQRRGGSENPCDSRGLVGGMVLLEGIELSTSPLPRECSTTELQQRRPPTQRLHRGLLLAWQAARVENVKRTQTTAQTAPLLRPRRGVMREGWTTRPGSAHTPRRH